MTSRLGQPNLPADDQLQSNLEADRPESFVMIAGAGGYFGMTGVMILGRN